MTKFFLPKPVNPEKDYEDLAAFCSRSVPPTGRRVYSIAYTHDGDHWTATVGEQLHGVRIRSSRKRGQYHEQRTNLSDPATVLAIFPGSPYLVVTDATPITNLASGWVNPFMAGVPTAVKLFDNTEN